MEENVVAHARNGCHFFEAVKINPEQASAHNKLGLALARQGRLAEATEHFSKAVSINPDNDDMHNNLGVALTNQGRFEEAIKHFSKAIQINPSNAKAHENLMKTSVLTESNLDP